MYKDYVNNFSGISKFCVPCMEVSQRRGLTYYYYYQLLILLLLKEQFPVTAHAPNFDFWTGCREIKRCQESKRTLKNPVASLSSILH